MSAPTSVFEESPGVRSSKRVAGLLMIAAGGAGLAAVIVVSLASKEPLANVGPAIQAGGALIATGSLLLGVTVVEAFAK